MVERFLRENSSKHYQSSMYIVCLLVILQSSITYHMFDINVSPDVQHEDDPADPFKGDATRKVRISDPRSIRKPIKLLLFQPPMKNRLNHGRYYSSKNQSDFRI